MSKETPKYVLQQEEKLIEAVSILSFILCYTGFNPTTPSNFDFILDVSQHPDSWFNNESNCFLAVFCYMILQDCDIAAASMKLAACQETIVNLGKQLKALASPQDAPLFDKVISSPATAKSKRRLQLVDHMREEDQTKPESPNTKEVICTEAPKTTTAAASENHQSQKEGSVRSIMDLPQEKSLVSNVKCGTDAGMLMVAPKKQKGRGGFLRKLLLQR